MQVGKYNLRKLKKFYDNDDKHNSLKIYFGDKRLLVDELNHTKERLENDVGIYFEAIMNTYRTTGRIVGFFGSIRLLVPVIEHLTFLLYGNRKRENRNLLLRELGIDFPELTWHIFRHPLIHGDEMGSFSVGRQIVDWRIIMSNTGHDYVLIGNNIKLASIQPNINFPVSITIDSLYLYNSLNSFLTEKINKLKGKETTHVFVHTKIKKYKLSKPNKSGRSKKIINREVIKEVDEIKRIYTEKVRSM